MRLLVILNGSVLANVAYASPGFIEIGQLFTQVYLVIVFFGYAAFFVLLGNYFLKIRKRNPSEPIKFGWSFYLLFIPLLLANVGIFVFSRNLMVISLFGILTAIALALRLYLPKSSVESGKLTKLVAGIAVVGLLPVSDLTLRVFFGYYVEKVVDSTPNSSFNMAKEGCVREDPQACFDLANLYTDLYVKYGNRKKYPHVETFIKSCNLGHAEGCYKSAQKVISWRGLGSESEFYKKGCDLNHQRSCATLGTRLEEAKEIKKAEALYQSTCEKGEDLGCLRQGYLLRDRKKSKAAQEYHQKACDLGSEIGCRNVATIEYEDLDKPKGFSILDDLCKKKDEMSCNYIGITYYNEKKWELARKYLYQARPVSSSFFLGIAEEKLGNLKAAIPLYQESCDRSYEPGGCNNYALHVAKAGKLDVAKKYYKYGCNLGLDLACKNLKGLKDEIQSKN